MAFDGMSSEPLAAALERFGPELVPCGCGQCGRSFLRRRTGYGQARVYAEGCPVRKQRVADANRASSRASYERRLRRSPRRCRCGCGKLLPERVWYHPDCKAAKADREAEPAKARTSRGLCRLCWGQPWRCHPVHGCPRCKRAYAPERRRADEPSVGCGLGQIA